MTQQLDQKGRVRFQINRFNSGHTIKNQNKPDADEKLRIRRAIEIHNEQLALKKELGDMGL